MRGSVFPQRNAAPAPILFVLLSCFDGVAAMIQRPTHVCSRK
jgi:hypothetical protein